jgi:hypothetical protein
VQRRIAGLHGQPRGDDAKLRDAAATNTTPHARRHRMPITRRRWLIAHALAPLAPLAGCASPPGPVFAGPVTPPMAYGNLYHYRP